MQCGETRKATSGGVLLPESAAEKATQGTVKEHPLMIFGSQRMFWYRMNSDSADHCSHFLK